MVVDAHDMSSLRQQAESLIQRAVDEGANVDFQRVRRIIALGEKYNYPPMLNGMIGHMENGIAAVNSEKRKQSFRKPFILKIKNLHFLKVKNLFKLF